MYKSQPRRSSTCVKFGNDPDRDPECMTSHPVLGFLAISRKIFVVETSSQREKIRLSILLRLVCVRLRRVSIGFSLWRHQISDTYHSDIENCKFIPIALKCLWHIARPVRSIPWKFYEASFKTQVVTNVWNWTFSPSLSMGEFIGHFMHIMWVNIS